MKSQLRERLLRGDKYLIRKFHDDEIERTLSANLVSQDLLKKKSIKVEEKWTDGRPKAR